jgi:hypothetical protein
MATVYGYSWSGTNSKRAMPFQSQIQTHVILTKNTGWIAPKLYLRKKQWSGYIGNPSARGKDR